jgi:hypothetical protein
MDEKERQKITIEAKKLLDKFSIALEDVKSSQESNVERLQDRRKEKEGVICQNDFRTIMLENAPAHDSDFIIAEKKTW